MTSPLSYKPTEVPEGHFRISPSRFSEFVSKPYQWYREVVLGEDGFNYSTASVIGTCVHWCAEQIAKKMPVEKSVINEYIRSLEDHEDYDKAVVEEAYLPMAETLVNDYVLENQFLAVEMPVVANIRDKYSVAGTLDALQGDKQDCMVSDYKSYNSKTKPKAIPMHYRYQLLVYAWALIKNGYNVTRIRLIYVNRHIDGGISEKTGKPLKSYPPEVTVLTEQITQEDIDFIDGLLNLCVDSVEAAEKHPELRHVIFHDPRLKVE